MDIINNGYVWQRLFYCKDCQQMKCTIGRLVCDECNEIRRELAYEDRVQDDIEREADEKDLRDTNRSIISSFYPF